MSKRERQKPGIAPTVIAGVWSLSVILLSFTPILDYVSQQVSRPIEFRVRSLLGQSPTLDPRIKVYAFDDQTANYLGYHDLTLESWLHLIEHFGAQKPRAIYIDQLFSLPMQERILEPLRPETAQNFVERIRKTQVPVISGGFISASQLPGRHMLSMLHPDYQFKDGSWPPIEQGYFYGPHASIRDAFHVGHITNSDYGYARPFIRTDPNSLIPHAAFLSLGSLRAKKQNLFLGEQQIPLNQNLLIPINFSDREEYTARGKTKSLKFVFERMRQGQPEPGLSQEDVIVILPGMFTGNTDWKDTPIGRLQGGYFGVALVNSVFQQQWLRESTPANILLLFLFLAISMLATLHLAPLWAALTLMLLTLSLPSGGLLLFAYQGLIVPWLWISLTTAFGGSIVLIERMRAENHKSKLLISSLRGALSPELADSIAQNPKILHGDPVEQIVTIMFVDIVGFSLTTERLTAKESFQQLKAQISYIVEQIHSFGGLVDKSLGDGVLAFFGYHYEKSNRLTGHADQALRCAIEIQKESLRRARELSGSGHPIYPLRIGINTATVYIGNLGTEGRIDFTLIGNGVNFTARLEHACQPYRIMIGLSTFDLLAQFSQRNPEVSSREVRIKHHTRPIRCFEYNPFYSVPGELRAVLDYYGEYHKLYTSEPRWYLEAPDYLPLQTSAGQAKLVNFSAGGVAVILKVQLNVEDPLRLILAREEGVPPLEINVRTCWSRPLEADQFIHGCQFKDTIEMQDSFVQSLRGRLASGGKNPSAYRATG
jgi:class 3 adenylate cyclase